MSLTDSKKQMDDYLKELERAVKMTVKVGLPSDKVGGEVYSDNPDGPTIMQIGAQHEYGTEHMAARSFLRMPFDLHRAEIDKYIGAQFMAVMHGTRTAEDALELVGAKAMDISKGAFRNNGYGQWAELKESTKATKQKAGKTTPLIWYGILRNAITWSIQK